MTNEILKNRTSKLWGATFRDWPPNYNSTQGYAKTLMMESTMRDKS
jgi:hypothetical protein